MPHALCIAPCDVAQKKPEQVRLSRYVIPTKNFFEKFLSAFTNNETDDILMKYPLFQIGINQN